MKKSYLYAMIVSLFAIVPVVLAATPAPTYKAGELLVKYKPAISSYKTSQYSSTHKIQSIKAFKRIGAQLVKLPDSMSVEQALEIYNNDPDVEYAEPNYYRYATATPNDTDFSELWGLENTGLPVNGTAGTVGADIDATTAWDTETGDGSIVIAVIDTGVAYDHPEFTEPASENIWANGDEAIDGTDTDSNGYIDDTRGWDFVSDDNDPMDYNSHGTHVAGTIAAQGNNGAGITGVCWDAAIMPIRVLDASGTGLTSDIISGIEYADNNGAVIINLSLASTAFSQSEKDAIDASSALFVCAAGNEGANNDSTPSYPASYTSANIISVAATDQDDALADFSPGGSSNYGATSVDVAAPGVNIYSTIPPGRTTIWSDDFQDGDITNWTTGGTNNTWGLETNATVVQLTDSPDASYVNDTDSWAYSEDFSLAGANDALLTFYCGGSVQDPDDILTLQVSTDGAAWTDELSGTDFTADGIYMYYTELDLTPYEGNATVYIRFHFFSDNSVIGDGWYIDDIIVSSADAYDGSEYDYSEGTSMAAPHVAGLAGLILSADPTLTAIEVKTGIENSAEVLTALSGRVATGARINAASYFTGILQFSSSTYQVSEGGGAAAITVTRGGSSTGAVSVDCATIAGGTAVEGTDYTALPATNLNWADGETGIRTINVSVTNNTVTQGDKTVFLQLSNPMGAVLGLADATLTIQEDDYSASDYDDENRKSVSSGCFIESAAETTSIKKAYKCIKELLFSR